MYSILVRKLAYFKRKSAYFSSFRTNAFPSRIYTKYVFSLISLYLEWMTSTYGLAAPALWRSKPDCSSRW